MDARRRPAADAASWRNVAYPTGGDVVDPVFNQVCPVLLVCPLPRWPFGLLFGSPWQCLSGWIPNSFAAKKNTIDTNDLYVGEPQKILPFLNL